MLLIDSFSKFFSFSFYLHMPFPDVFLSCKMILPFGFFIYDIWKERLPETYIFDADSKFQLKHIGVFRINIVAIPKLFYTLLHLSPNWKASLNLTSRVILKLLQYLHKLSYLHEGSFHNDLSTHFSPKTKDSPNWIQSSKDRSSEVDRHSLKTVKFQALYLLLFPYPSLN